ncbi:MAG: deoxyribose-phosphate aldolase, partial [Actinomycetota bacterium]
LNMNLKPYEVARMIDVSVLKTTSTEIDIQMLVDSAKKYHFICAFSLSCYLPTLVKELKGSDTLVGAPIGFPSGAEMSEIKAFQAKTLYDIGCDEFDMVLNVGWLKSGEFDKVEKDIRAVHDVISGKPLKVIVEAMYLTDKELVDACSIVVNSGADYIKTGTGWAEKPTEFSHIETMVKAVKGKIKIKAAGGIKDYDTLCRMHDMGVSRFGVGVNSGISIVEEALLKQ